MHLEIERKYPGADFELARAKLRAICASGSGAHFETNAVFEKDGEELLASGRLLRLRKMEWPGKSVCLLTLKTPADRLLLQTERTCKVRGEFETVIENFEAMTEILAGLGYRPAARYEKIRETWSAFWPPENSAEAGQPCQMEVDLDTLPFCHVIEIEGQAGQMDSLARFLGLDKIAISTKSYHELHQEWLKANSLPPSASFVFEPNAKERLRASLGLA